MKHKNKEYVLYKVSRYSFVIEETVALIVHITYNKLIEKIWQINL